MKQLAVVVSTLMFKDQVQLSELKAAAALVELEAESCRCQLEAAVSVQLTVHAWHGPKTRRSNDVVGNLVLWKTWVSM